MTTTPTWTAHLAAAAYTAFLSTTLLAQSEALSPIPDPMRHRETIETGDSDGDDLLPPSEEGDQRLVREATASRPVERRANYSRGVSLALGPNKPWQTYTFELGSLLRPDVFLAFYGGGGSFNDNGATISDQSYDLSLAAVGAGATARYFLHNLDLLALEGTVGLNSWSGRLVPHGSNTSGSDPTQSLSDSFHAIGLSVGIAAALSWVWDNGYFIDWTMAGLQVGKTFRVDNTRSDGAVDKALRSDLENLRIYGLIDIRVGRYF